METQTTLSITAPVPAMTLTEIISVVQRLSLLEKFRLIRILAEELESGENIFPFEPNKVYDLPTPYNAFGAAEILANAMATFNEEGNGKT